MPDSTAHAPHGVPAPHTKPAAVAGPAPATTTLPAGRSATVALRRTAAWIATGLWAGVIFRFSALPGSQIPGRFGELGHLGEYAIFGGLLYLALRVDLDRGRALAIAIIAASAYGVSDEFHQHFVVMRTPDVTDWGLDTLGAACGALAVAVAVGRLSRFRSAPQR
jgi:VanZ family protein